MGLCIIGDSMLYATLPACYPDLGLGAGTVGAVLSVNRFIRIGFNSLAVVMIQRFGFKAMLVLASALATSSTLGYALAHHPVTWISLRVAWGMAWSLVRLSAQALAIYDSGRCGEGRALGSLQRLVRVGSATGAVAGGFLADRIGFRPSAAILGTITGVAAILAVWGIAKEAASPSVAGSTTQRGAASSVESAVRLMRAGWLVYLTVFTLALSVTGVLMSTVGVLLKTRVPANGGLPWGLGVASFAGVILSSRWLADIFLAPQVGSLSDRTGRTRPIAAMLGAQLVASVLLLRLTPIVPLVMTEAALFVLQSCLYVLLCAAAADLRRHGGGLQALSIHATFQDLGEAFGPLVAFCLLVFGLTWTYVFASLILGFLLVLWVLQAICASRARRSPF